MPSFREAKRNFSVVCLLRIQKTRTRNLAKKLDIKFYLACVLTKLRQLVQACAVELVDHWSTHERERNFGETRRTLNAQRALFQECAKLATGSLGSVSSTASWRELRLSSKHGDFVYRPERVPDRLNTSEST